MENAFVGGRAIASASLRAESAASVSAKGLILVADWRRIAPS
jgi:hypothetical protein